MKQIIKYIKATLFLVITAIGGYFFYGYFYNKPQQAEPADVYLTELRIKELIKQAEPTSADTAQEAAYDFKRMLNLISAGEKVWRQHEPTFEKPYKKNSIDSEYISSLHQELMYERTKLKNYIWDLKGYSKSGIPIKKYRSLLYYLEVIDQHISHMRIILSKKEAKS